MNRSFVVTSGLDIGAPIAAALAAGGARVAWLNDVEGGDAGAGVENVATGFGTRAEVDTAFGAAVAAVGVPGQVIVSVLPLVSLDAADITTLPQQRWHAACGAALKSVLHVLQACHNRLGAQGGSIVVIGPSLALAGAPQLVPLCSALEGQRGLVKSAARQWGRLGLTLNWIAAAPHALSPRFAGLALPVKPDPVPVALGRAPELAADIVPVLQFLGSPAGRVVTGATLLLDGGEWMLP